MFNLRIVAVPLIALASVNAPAQTPEITVDSRASSNDIQTWLSSGDPRLIAWCAYFARVNGDDDATAQMLRLADGWKTPDMNREPSGQLRADAMAEVLDALIERKGDVSLQGLAAIAKSFPTQTAILASRKPIAESTPLLLQWYGDGTGDTRGGLQRIAAMMLSKAPPPGFAAGVLAASVEHLTILVVDHGRGGSGFGSGCGDAPGSGTLSGWPPIASYRIEENRPDSTAPLLIEAGGDRITWHREAESGGWGSCFGVSSLNDWTRHHLLAQMLGVDKKDMPWKAVDSATIQWQSSDAFLQELRDQVAAQEAKLHETVEALFQKGFLTAGEVDSVRPKLPVTVMDARETKSPALPQWEANDARTIIELPVN